MRFNHRYLFSCSLVLAIAFSTASCNLPNLPANLPSNLPSTSTPSSNTPQGKIQVIGAELFDKYPLNYRVGMQWVYSMKMPGVSLPALPGFNTSQLPNLSQLLPSNTSEMGELTMTVTAIHGDLVTMETTVKMNITSPTSPAPTSVTFNKNTPAALYSQMNQDSKTTGTYTYTLIGPESVSVAAGTYQADKIKGRLEATTQIEAGTVNSNQDSLLWMAAGVGMVKQETTTVTAGVTATNILELKRFTP